MDTLENLASFYRISLNNGSNVITVRDEIQLVENYLHLQKMRYIEFMDYMVAFSPNIYDYSIPKLTLQPLVENAIIHGVADRDDGYIKVQAVQEGDDLVLRVSDNGCGMTPEVLERLNSVDKRIPGGHLGLYNTDSIIRLRFGAAYGLTARSVPGEGSCVSLRMPIQREEAGDAEGADR